MSDTDSTPIDEALLSLQEAGRLVAANLDAAVLDIMTTSTPPVDGITMPDSVTASVASGTARTYKSNGRVLEFEVDDENPIDKPTQAGSLFKKEHRPPVGSNDMLEFIKSITTKQGDPYKEINQHPGKGTQLLANEDGSAKEMHLFTHCRQFTCDQVAASYRYYALNVRCSITSTIVNDTITTIKGTFHNDKLEWTYSYFRNNAEPRLYEKVQNELATFGPLK